MMKNIELQDIEESHICKKKKNLFTENIGQVIRYLLEIKMTFIHHENGFS